MWDLSRRTADDGIPPDNSLSFDAMKSSYDHSDGPSSPQFWDELYSSGATGWDLGSSTPVFRDVVQRQLIPATGSVLVVGAGKGHDAILFAQHGYDVVAVDFAPTAIQIARTNAEDARVAVQFIQTDLFHLGAAYRHCFDLMVEYTVFCAIDPSRRREYLEMSESVLKPGGLLVGLFFPIDGREGGPPFAVDAKEVEQLFSKSFTLEHKEIPTSSVKPRRGKEILLIWKRA